MAFLKKRKKEALAREGGGRRNRRRFLNHLGRRKSVFLQKRSLDAVVLILVHQHVSHHSFIHDYHDAWLLELYETLFSEDCKAGKVGGGALR